MKWELFQSQFHPSWWGKMKLFVESVECDKIYKFLKSEVKRGRKIVPLSSNVFRCFKETPYDELKVVMCGLSPYHTMKGNIIVADGLLMGCSSTGKLQASLEKFYDALYTEMYQGRTYNRNPDVKFLAKQGVLMLNASLTTEYMKPGSHLELWDPFIKYLFEEVLSGVNVPIIFLGKEASKCKKYVSPWTWVFEVSHPASSAYSHTDWQTEGVFQKVNKVLMDSNGWTIEWLDLSKDVLF